jgi:uncharacterized membrane protein
MTDRVQQLASELLQTAVADLTPRERKVLGRIASHRHISRDVARAYDAQMTLGARLADGVARVGGSWGFVSGFGLFLLVWAALNSIVLPRLSLSFDPYPYIFLNLMLSMLAAVQAPIIMMSQNRQAEKDRVAAEHDYEVNLKAELEIMALHEKLDQLRSEHLDQMLRKQEEQLALLLRLSGRPAPPPE